MEGGLVFYQMWLRWMHKPFDVPMKKFYACGLGTFLILIAGLWVFHPSFYEKVLRFLSLKDGAVRISLLGCSLLGLNCGALGSIMVVRRLSLIGDSLSHAVLPGIVLGFLFAEGKSPLALLLGALIASTLSAVCIHLLKTTTRLKEDSILGLVLSGFYALGICLLTMIQHIDLPGKAGLHLFLLGQASALGGEDLVLIGWVSVIVLAALALFYKEWLVSSFDSVFASTAGIASQSFHYGLMLLLSLSIVTALKATGAVLVTALLILPAATAYLLTHRLHWMILLSMLFGALSASLGLFISFLGPKLPTGPIIVCVGASFFTFTFLFSPSQGVLLAWLQQKAQKRRVLLENTLKQIYKLLEKEGFRGHTFSVENLAQQMRLSQTAAWSALFRLKRKKLILQTSAGFSLSPLGWEDAKRIIRNHRLWELYLTHYASYPLDHVHEDAEKIEHLLNPALVQTLNKALDYPLKDPHGQAIPSPYPDSPKI